MKKIFLVSGASFELLRDLLIKWGVLNMNIKKLVNSECLDDNRIALEIMKDKPLELFEMCDRSIFRYFLLHDEKGLELQKEIVNVHMKMNSLVSRKFIYKSHITKFYNYHKNNVL